ncbi:hypothetical protein T05_12902 [Trichinella murrelli]|uniref:Uncharacterized protein n=1 Tax=Trichinella murrelli TaxID=144512 RepID=A0A0V0U773_9BILA|nr:hypothetical protein T05_12902 [Trichinella murrelli]
MVFNNFIPFEDMVGKRFFSLLYGCFLKLNDRVTGKFTKSGQIFSFGEPNRSMISRIWSISPVPGNSGLWRSSSPNTQAVAQMSMAEVIRSLSKSSSGALYHMVTTLGVIRGSGLPQVRAKPKSDIFNVPSSLRSKFDAFRSRWTM